MCALALALSLSLSLAFPTAGLALALLLLYCLLGSCQAILPLLLSLLLEYVTRRLHWWRSVRIEVLVGRVEVVSVDWVSLQYGVSHCVGLVWPRRALARAAATRLLLRSRFEHPLCLGPRQRCLVGFPGSRWRAHDRSLVPVG